MLVFIVCIIFRVWCVRFNPFHDQLLLTASSDARVLISSAASVSSESNTENILSEDSTVTPEPKQMSVNLIK